MKPVHTVRSLLSKYEHEIQSIKNNMAHYTQWGGGPYWSHRLATYQRFAEELRAIITEEERHDGDQP